VVEEVKSKLFSMVFVNEQDIEDREKTAPRTNTHPK
jgi:hypothetical protein